MQVAGWSKITRVLLGTLAAALPAAVWTGAESTPEASAWLEKMTRAYASGYRVSYSADMSVRQQGQSISMQMKGMTTQTDRRHMRMELDITMRMGEMQTGMAMLGVVDGATFWLESDNPMTGGKQVTRMPADLADKMSENGMQLAGGVGGVDPVGQIEQMVTMFDFEVGDSADGKVTLLATMNDEILADLSAVMPDAEGMDRFVLVLDERTSFPVEMRIGGDPPFMTMTFDDVEFIDGTELDPAVFQYTPPEGSEVVDMGARMSGEEP